MLCVMEVHMSGRLEYTPEYRDLVRKCGMLEISRRAAYQKGTDLLFTSIREAEHAFEEAGRLSTEIAQVYGEMVKLQCAGRALMT
jgi:hypothetical protein